MWLPRLAAATAIVIIAVLLQRWHAGAHHHPAADGKPPDGTNPYAIIGVPSDADKGTIIKAYRKLAKRWHPDRNRGDAAAASVFATIAHAYDVLLNPETREVYDRLGAEGLERHRDGDPSTRKDWLPPEEVLRRIHNDGDEALLASMVTSSFAALGNLLGAWQQQLRSLVLRLGVQSESPSVYISATDASGAALSSGGSTATGVTFKFALSGKSFNFEEKDVTHNCLRFKFLGMKTAFYLQCEHEPGLDLSVSVPAGAFTVTDRKRRSLASNVFQLHFADGREAAG